MDDDLFPHRAPIGVLQKVHFIKHHDSKVIERP